jgi:hypothetical protein
MLPPRCPRGLSARLSWSLVGLTLLATSGGCRDDRELPPVRLHGSAGGEGGAVSSPATGEGALGGGDDGGSEAGAATAEGGGEGGTSAASGGVMSATTAGAGGAPEGGAVGQAGASSAAGGTAAAGTAGSAGAPSAAGAAGAAGAHTLGADAETLYDVTQLVTFELTIPQACRDALDANPTEYCEGSVTYRPPSGEPQDFPTVGIRLKGRASFQPLSEKPSFKVKLDEYTAGARLFGVRRLTLNNMVQDPSMAHEVLGYRYLRAAGVPAPLCNYARVVVDGEPYGLYANLETLDDEFAERRFDPAPGNLYDTSNDDYFVDLEPRWLGSYQLETNQDVPDTSDLEALIEAAGSPSSTFYATVGELLDWDEVLTLGAAQALIADWDGYFGAANNYELYHELARDRFLILPWGIDQTFGTTDSEPNAPEAHLRYAVDHSTSERDNGILFQRCWADETCRADYLVRVEDALAVWNELPLSAELDAALELTAAAREEDQRRPYGDTRSANFVAGLRTFLDERGGIVAAQLDQLGAMP